MKTIQEVVSVQSLEELRRLRNDHYADALSLLGRVVEERSPRKLVNALVGVLPRKNLVAPPQWIRLYVVTSGGTEYAAVRGVEEVISKYYQATGTLVSLEPLRRRRGVDLKIQFPEAARVIATRGALVYANE